MGAFSQGRITPDALFQNPSYKPIAGLLGIGDFEFSNRYGLRLGSQDARKLARTAQGSQHSAFGPESMSRISNWLQGGQRNDLQDVIPSQMAAAFEPAIGMSNEFFSGTVAPGLEELATTGFRADTSGLRDAALHGFRSQTLPEAYEGLSAFGSGLASSDASNTVGRLAADLEAELYGFELGADESAANRRAYGIPMAQGMFDENALKQLASADAALAFGNTLEGSSAESQMFNAMMAMSGMGGQINQPQPMIFGRTPSKFQEYSQAFNSGMSGLTDILGAI
tara:strand:- start:65 stop:910 length:846 start_codon:yes stop_codon:yes gene_type:complete